MNKNKLIEYLIFISLAMISSCCLLKITTIIINRDKLVLTSPTVIEYEFHRSPKYKGTFCHAN